MATILDRILERTRSDVAATRNSAPLAEIRRRAIAAPPRRDFLAPVGNSAEVRIIAELKRASPSAGIIREPFDPANIAQAYERGGAAALSVLTDGPFFQGSLDDLCAVRAATKLPILRKDFIIDEYQIVEARAYGADAILLIAEALPGSMLREFFSLATGLGLDALVEFHDADQLDRVLQCGARMVGINNRDLRTFETRLEHSLHLASQIPADRLIVSESGIRTSEDVTLLQGAGIRAVLVGESLLRQKNIAEALFALRGVAR